MLTKIKPPSLLSHLLLSLPERVRHQVALLPDVRVPRAVRAELDRGQLTHATAVLGILKFWTGGFGHTNNGHGKRGAVKLLVGYLGIEL